MSDIDVDKFLKELWYENWMSENDWNQFKSDLLTALDTTEENIENMIRIGNKNGITQEDQLEVVKKFYETKNKSMSIM